MSVETSIAIGIAIASFSFLVGHIRGSVSCMKELKRSGQLK